MICYCNHFQTNIQCALLLLKHAYRGVRRAKKVNYYFYHMRMHRSEDPEDRSRQLFYLMGVEFNCINNWSLNFSGNVADCFAVPAIRHMENSRSDNVEVATVPEPEWINVGIDMGSCCNCHATKDFRICLDVTRMLK